MCGQAGIHRRSTRPVPKLESLANELLLAIEPRGGDATGMLAVLDSGKVQLQKDATPARRFVRQRQRVAADARTVLLHTRYATTGSKTDPRNAHPHAAGTIAATHNGTIYNADEVFETFGLKRRATVDSEVIPAIVNYAGWDNVEDALGLLRGGAAVALVNTDRPTEVVLARLQSYPLVYIATPSLVLWASTEDAIRRAWYRTYGAPLRAKARHLAEGDIARVNGKVTVSRMSGFEAPKVRRSSVVIPPRRRRKKKAARRAPAVTYAQTRMRIEEAYASADEEVIATLIDDGWSRAEAELQVYGNWDDIDTSGMSPATLAWMALD